ncbi:hypothetical protein CHS0354_035266 [Potamilus streckersoni]|uniref:rRNA adenine N(6)-methyltransferase n=1 Tax=Potamilus streckersoni TaxID=2493646 RepID=A0AAE0S3C1_9BIVA|nr:hypothetical protein CHS0354_035266 [Potamilus streckersoni]
MLTDELIKLNARFEAVEVDRDLCAHLRQRYNGEQGFKLTEGDILEMNWETAIFPGDMFTLVFEQRARIRRAILLLQKEFADRILGDHLKSKEEYGSLTVLFSLFFERHEIMTVEAEDFYPPPKVRSTEDFCQIAGICAHPARQACKRYILCGKLSEAASG